MKTDTQPVRDDFRQQVFGDGGPGTVLRDFETLLEFIGPDGMRATSKYHALPLDRLKELDERMSQPLRPFVKRPQLRSFPVLEGLFLLLRASGLGVGQGSGKSGRLCLNPDVLISWRTLNPTERYFSLLETWLLHASFDIIGERGTCLETASTVWSNMRRAERKSSGKDGGVICSFAPNCILALFESFGLASFHRPPRSRQSDGQVAFQWSGFGSQLMELVFGEFTHAWEIETNVVPKFGALLPLLQEYFPDLKRLLSVPAQEFRDGVFEFTVSLGEVWRRIAIPATNCLDELAQAIVAAYKFDDDHLYEFQLRTRQGRDFCIAHPCINEAAYSTDDYPIGDLPLRVGDAMVFLFDFGDSWEFQVVLDGIDPTNRKLRKARLVASKGKAPPQYVWDD